MTVRMGESRLAELVDVRRAVRALRLRVISDSSAHGVMACPADCERGFAEDLALESMGGTQYPTWALVSVAVAVSGDHSYLRAVAVSILLLSG